MTGHSIDQTRKDEMTNNMIFSKHIQIGSKRISEDTGVFIIAEAGVNHNGDIKLAKKMVDVAIEAGVDAIKFQSFKTEKLILKNTDKAPYQKKTTSQEESQYEMLKRLEMGIDQMREIKQYCDQKGIVFMSTPFEEASLVEMVELDVAAIKIAATDLTNIKFLRQVAQAGKPIILSAGMCYMDEVVTALEAINPLNKNVILLQCTANYPIRDTEANVKVVNTFCNNFNMLIGYSDHSEGVGASPYAVAIGAKVIEKHFTLDKNMEGPDHKASVTPGELKQLVREIRKVERYLGNGKKMPSASEQQTRKALQKCLVAKKAIVKGEKYTLDNIDAKRTNGKGISALYYDNMIGEYAQRNYNENDIIEL